MPPNGMAKSHTASPAVFISPSFGPPGHIVESYFSGNVITENHLYTATIRKHFNTIRKAPSLQFYP